MYVYVEDQDLGGVVRTIDVMKGLVKCSANYVPLTPIGFLERAALFYGDETSIVYGNSVRFSWKETHQRCLKFAASLVRLGISRHDVVAAFALNVPALYELHFAVPMAGAVLSALNFRLNDTMLALILQQLEPKFILVDHQFVHIVLKALNTISQTAPNCKPTLVLIPECDQKTSSSLSSSSSSSSSSLSSNNNILNYNDLIEAPDHGDLEFEIIRPTDECDPISVNYTSGSTGNPKGVIYSHRAVYLNSLALILNMDKRRVPVFLWTVDMFRCNGWCYPWAIAALGGTNICLRNTNLSAKIILDAISLHKVTHLCGKPIILNILAEALDGKPLASRVDIVIAGALPSHQILTKVTEMGFNISHGYGMTEALGPQIIEPWRPELPHSHIANGDNKGDDDDKSSKRYRGENLGRYHHNLMIMERFDVKDPSTMESIPNDGETMGEIMFRGNTLMSGYVKNSKATEEAYNGGWYRTGDVGIRHQDGSVRMKDRAEDIVICGGNAISTLEVEAVLLSHPNVLEAAVVGRHDECLGEIPCAFVKLKKGCESTITSSKEIIEFCGNNLPAYYMVPHAVIFGDLPVNSTGKVQKFVLRDMANAANGSD